MSLPLDVWIKELKDTDLRTDITDLGEFLVEGVGYERHEDPDGWTLIFTKDGWFPLTFPLQKRSIPQRRLLDILDYVELRLSEEGEI